MVNRKEQVSIRIVSVDHYMSKPDAQFDATYSEFRGAEVKQVPVIRLFGSTTEGTHSCVHIHGVFPYFYVPYDEPTNDRLVVDQKIYQLANALDKAINVALAKSMSQTKHVFKIVLVKGFPIYGYHRNAHHYLKIYMYNPMLVRKATQLLMNGTVLCKHYQVHETHIPYILQFFIDYNLYGMSYLDLDAKGLRQRKSTTETVNNVVPPKMSTSEYEIDVLASDILNREPEDSADGGEFANPGIASIWKDEQARRMLLGLQQPERLNLSQDSGTGAGEVVTESDRFYRAMLVSKLSQKPTPSTSVEERKKVPSSAYPSEVVEGEVLLNASYIANHMRDNAGRSNESLYDSQISYHFDVSSMIDEDKIVSMSQNPNATLMEDDYDVLEIMRGLEEQETNNFEGDCLLAPLTQQSGESNRSIIQSLLNASQANKLLNASLSGDLDAVCLLSKQLEPPGTGMPEDAGFDSDDEFLLDFTQKQQIDGGGQQATSEIERYFNYSDDELLMDGCIPQLDGGDDSLTSAMSSKRLRGTPEGEGQQSSSAKKVRFDVSTPTGKKASTPRRVSFAPSPPEKMESRSARVLKEFEISSPNLLKNFEIRVNKLDVDEPLDHSQLGTIPSNVDAFPLKSLHVHVAKLDLTKFETSPTKSTHDRYQQARDYDQLHNYDPMEGPSTPKFDRVDRKAPTKGRKGQPKAKRLKLQLEEEQQIEVILSEQFKSIVRLSPKVLIKPLLLIENAAAYSDVSLSKCIPESNPSVLVGEEKIPDKDRQEENVVSDDECSVVAENGVDPSSTSVNSTETKQNDESTVTGSKETLTISDKTDETAKKAADNIVTLDVEECEKDSDGMDVEFSCPTSSDTGENTRETSPIIAVEDSSSSEDEVLPKANESVSQAGDSGGEKEIVTIVDDDDDGDNDIQMITPSIFDDLSSIERFDNNSVDKTVEPLAVTIGSQLDGVGEMMDTSGDSGKANGKENISNDTIEEADAEDDQAYIQSFCETTLLCELDDINADSDDSCLDSAVNVITEGNEQDEVPVVISLATKAPTRKETLSAIESLEIPPVVNPTPFYSDPADVTGKKEVGHTVLHIAGNSLNDAEEFTSNIAGLSSLKHLRYDNLQRTYGESIDDVMEPVGANGPNSDRMKELLASEKAVVITPSELPPTRADANLWIDDRCRKRATVETAATEDRDSPIKVKPAETIMMLADDEVNASLPPPPPQIDSASSLNLSVLVANDGATAAKTNGESTKQLVSKIMTMNSLATSQSSEEEGTGGNTNKSNQDEASTKEQSSTQSGDIRLPSPAGFAPSDQSNETTLEQSNANISTATPINDTFGFKVNYENLQEAKSKCEITILDKAKQFEKETEGTEKETEKLTEQAR